MQWLSLLIYCGFVLAITDGTLFVERGSRGIVPCPLAKSRKLSRENVDAMYWYYGSMSDISILISYFLGRVAPQNGIPEGVYDIDDEFNLIIENVNASNEGTYFWKLKPHLKAMDEGQVEVCVKVSPRRPYPTVIGCNQVLAADTCEMSVQPNSTVHNLTCVIEQVKPAVELRWIHLFLGGKTELKASTSVWPEVLPAYTGALLRNNTYSTSASVQVTKVDGDNEVYLCEAIGVAVGKGARMRVRLTKAHHTTVPHEEVQSDNPGSSLRTNTYSTSASVQVPAVDSQEACTCEAMGVEGNGERIIVHLTKTHHVQSSNNLGTTLVWADEGTPTANKPAQNTVPVIALGVALTFALIFIVIMCIRLVYLQKKCNEFNRALERRPYAPVPTTSGDNHEMQTTI
ncbi:uncharacterized protein LOC119736699 [Patiria miniata]|uniref:Ig-like domain-containing protein n=1 Tax=Patiria miniata TaxID=46514 RepID=A0A914ATH3_PATMI|nr:uncharacterized protein LOC119736699 [Patiria miniata]